MLAGSAGLQHPLEVLARRLRRRSGDAAFAERALHRAVRRDHGLPRVQVALECVDRRLDGGASGGLVGRRSGGTPLAG